jgi:broad specificity phosphatase PhoE
MKAPRPVHQQFYLIVYTQTDADVQGYYCGGGLDLGLNEAGLEAARKAARRFKKNPLKIKRIIAGPELRCVQMADVLHDEIKCKLLLSRQFGDQFLGEWEGRPLAPRGSSPLNAPETAPRGETPDAFLLRVEEGLETVLSEPLLSALVVAPRVAQAILHALDLASETIERGVLMAIDIPAGEGKPHLRVV